MTGDIRLGDDEVHIIGRRTKMLHNGDNKIDLHPEDGNITLGGHGSDGDLILQDEGENHRIQLDAHSGTPPTPFDNSTLRIYLDGNNANIHIGGDGEFGKIIYRSPAGKPVFVGEGAVMEMGGNGESGSMSMLDPDGKENAKLQDGVMTVGGDDNPGRIALRDRRGEEVLRLDGERTEFRLDGDRAAMVVNGQNLVETIEELGARVEELEERLEG